MVSILKTDCLHLTLSEDGIGTVRMNNGENRFRLSFVQEWVKILDEIERNEAIKGLVVIGSDKYFSLGLDVDYFKTQTSEYVEKTRNSIGQLYSRLMTLPIPTVAAINGHAFGAGAFLAMSFDYRVMRSDRGWLCWPEVNLNMRMRPSSYEMIGNTFSKSKAIRDAVLFGKRLTAKDSKEFNLVDVVTTKENLLSQAIDLVNQALGPRGLTRGAVQQVKIDLYEIGRQQELSNVSKL